MRTHLPEKVRGTNLRNIKSVPRVIYTPAVAPGRFPFSRQHMYRPI